MLLKVEYPPSWTRALALAAAHGVVVFVVFGGLLLLGGLVYPLVVLGVFCSLFVAFALRFPWTRIIGATILVSPLVAAFLASVVWSVIDSPRVVIPGAILLSLSGMFLNAVCAFFVILFVLRRRSAPDANLTCCAHCGYSMAGLPSRQCPECGTPNP